MAIRFTSTLQPSYREALEELIFFNANQSAVARGIVDTIDRYGIPKIVEQEHSLYLTVAGPHETQSLYALGEDGEHPELAGAVIYTRVDNETIVLLHMAISKDYCLNGEQSREMLAVRLVDRLKAIARQIKGVRFVQIAYADGRTEIIDIRRRDTQSCSRRKETQ